MKELKVKVVLVTVISFDLCSSINLLMFCWDILLQYQVLDRQASAFYFCLAC